MRTSHFLFWDYAALAIECTLPRDHSWLVTVVTKVDFQNRYENNVESETRVKVVYDYDVVELVFCASGRKVRMVWLARKRPHEFSRADIG